MVALFPPEIITIIFSHLRSHPATLLSCTLVNKEWGSLAQPWLYHSPCLLTRATWRKFFILLTVRPELAAFVRRLDLSRIVGRGKDIKEWEVSRVFSLCWAVEEVDLAGCNEIQHLSHMAARWGRLRRLCVSGCNIGGLSLLSVAEHCSAHLISVDLSRCPNISDEAALLLASRSPNLRHLDVSYCKVTDALLNGIGQLQRRGHLPELASLRCRQCIRLTHTPLEHIGVREIDLRGCSRVNDEFVVCKFLRRNVRLTSLTIGQTGGAAYVTDQLVVHLATHCPQIRELVLLGCLNVTGAGIPTLVSQCQGLEKLHLYKSGVTEPDVKALVMGLPRLRELNVSAAPKVNKEFMAAIGRWSNWQIDTIFPNFG